MDVKIQTWYASYYVEPLKKWIYGHLSLHPYGILFHDESKKPALTKDLVIKFEEFVVFKKASSSFIFGAITVVDRKSHTHWFSSFQDRSSVFATVNHFLLNSATQSESGSVKNVPEGEQTALGTNLLKIVCGSEKTLQHAATQLCKQGEQIDNSIATMHDLHNDLDVAANVVSGLESYLGRWQMPKKYIHVDPVVLKDKDVPQVFDYEMLCCKIDSKKFHSQKDGVVRISADGITILNLMQKVMQHFNWSDVSTIRVVSPWEMLVTQNFIGSPDLSYSVVCAHMIHILRKIELFPFGKRKLDYDAHAQQRLQDQSEDVGRAFRKPCPTPAYGGASLNMPGTKYDTSSLMDADLPVDSDVGPSQVSRNKEAISEREVDQLTATLSNLKSMALAVQHEEEVQNEKLDTLTESVDRANDKLKATTKRTKKLL